MLFIRSYRVHRFAVASTAGRHIFGHNSRLPSIWAPGVCLVNRNAVAVCRKWIWSFRPFPSSFSPAKMAER